MQRKREIRRRKRRRAFIRRLIQIGSAVILLGLLLWSFKILWGKWRPDAGAVTDTRQRFLTEAEKGLLADSLSLGGVINPENGKEDPGAKDL